MDFEKAYLKTLAKWQQIAAGVLISPVHDCSMCEWAGALNTDEEMCLCCPAYYHYGKVICVDAVADLSDAIHYYDHEDLPGLKRHAQLVVKELLAIKTSLFVEAKWIASRKS